MGNSDSDDWIKTEENPDDFDEGLGEDWESAFQAEEFIFSPGEGEGGDFFLEKTGSSTGYEFTPPDEKDLTDVPDLDQDTGNAERADPDEQKETADRPPTLTSLPDRWRALRKKFTALPLIHRLALGGTTLLITFLTLVLLWPAAPIPEPANAPAVSIQPPPAIAPAENIRRKWQFTPFILPVASDSAEKPSFLEVDLSLLLLLPDDELPTDKKLFVRDLIYRYYRQQPLTTLRRFALARGEMNRTLLAWLRTHWPEAPVEAVIFTRYQLT